MLYSLPGAALGLDLPSRFTVLNYALYLVDGVNIHSFPELVERIQRAGALVRAALFTKGANLS